MSIESKSDSEENFEDAIDTLEIEEQVPATTDLLQQQAPNVKLNQKPKFTYQASIPPPMGPPPPLPQDFSQHPSTSQIPPPLPPRRPLPRNPELSIAIPSIEIQENAMIQTQTEKRIPDQQIYGRQRGHTKTNSLDRGLISLAKCMKTGPFPPPTTSKSNSLTRGASPSDILPTVDEQDTQAQGVIQGVIQQVLLSDNPYLADEIDLKESNKESSSIIPSQDDEMENSKHKEIISDKIQSNASAVRRKAKSTGGSADERSNERTPGLSKKSIVPHYENLAEQALPKRNDQPEIGKLEEGGIKKIISTTVTGNSKKRIDEKQHRRSASDKSPTKVKTASAHHQKQKSSTWEPNHKTGILQKPDSIDPITRDVERRMSLKEKGNMSNNKQHDHNEANDASSSEEVFGQKHSAIEHIRRYGNVASDYLRGTMQKVRKQAAILTKSGNKSGKIIGAENDRDGASSVAESDELSLANCISETLPVPLTTPLNRRMRATNSAEPPNSSRTTTAATTSTIGICKPKNLKKGPFDFEQLRLVQELNHEHTGAIWCIKFSDCGRLLATAGQDRNVRVWVLRSQLNYFTSLRERYGQEVGANLDYSLMQHIGNMRPDLYDECVEEEEEERDKIGSGLGSGNGKEGEEGKPNSNSSKGPKGSLASSSSSFASSSRPQSAGANSTKPSFQVKATSTSCPSNFAIFSPKPFCVFRGHTADVLDLSWSPRNYFILSSGMDRTVKLWHLTRNECLCSFQHVDFVTCIAFMPKDDRYFISGSLDGKIRLWNIPEKRVAIWNEVEEQFVKYITAIAFVKSGKFVVVGTYSGRCFFYSTDQLKYHTVIDCRSSKAKNSRDHTKITALGVHGDKLLVTSNDSRIRIYDLRDMDLCCKFKGAQIEQSHIRAAFSPDGKYIVSGSEDNFVYLWRTSGLPSSLSVRKDQNHAWERIRAHQTVVTTAAFAPKPQLILSWLIEQQQKLCKLKMQPIASSTPEPTMENNISPPPITARADKNGQQSHQSAKESVERPFLALASRLALPTANLTDIQLIKRSKPSNASLGYSSSMLSIASAATQSVNETMGSGRDRRAMGDVIVSADLGGSLKIFVNATRLQTGASNFFPY